MIINKTAGQISAPLFCIWKALFYPGALQHALFWGGGGTWVCVHALFARV